MTKSKRLVALLLLVLCSLFASTVFASTRITSVTVEEKADSLQIRLATDAPDARVIPKLVCSPDAIRVRLLGLLGKTSSVEVLDLPLRGGITHARIIPRKEIGTVLHLVAEGSNMQACKRTVAVNLGGEILIATTLSPEEIRQRDRIQDLIEKSEEVAKEPAKPDPADTATATGEPDKDSGDNKAAPETAAVESPEPGTRPRGAKAATGAMALFNKGTKTAADPAGGDVTSLEGESNSIRYAAGICFALIIGFVAWQMKKKKGPGAKLHDIDILSARRIGPKQQLMLVSVQGAKVLLAVSDRSITTLNLPSGDELPSVHNDLIPVETKIDHGEARTYEPPSMPAEESGFKGTLRRAMRSKPVKSSSVVDPDPSNVEGLIALARNRFDAERAMRKNQYPEA